MSAASCAELAADRLARRLSAATCREVTLDYGGPRRDWWGGWHLRWTDGPTVVSMRALVSTYARHARVRGISFPSVGMKCTRDLTETGRAVSLLWFLRHHPGEYAWCPGLLDLAADHTEYPDFAPRIWRQRAEALIGCGAGTSVDRRGYETLIARARGGWADAVVWLDAVTDSHIRESLTVAE